MMRASDLEYDIEDIASRTGGIEEIGGRQEVGSRVVPSKPSRNHSSVLEASSRVP